MFPIKEGSFTSVDDGGHTRIIADNVMIGTVTLVDCVYGWVVLVGIVQCIVVEYGRCGACDAGQRHILYKQQHKVVELDGVGLCVYPV